MVMQKTGTTGEAILRVTSTNQARMPSAKWHGAGEACGQRPMARQKSMEITSRAHSVASKDMYGLIQAILHLALL